MPMRLQKYLARAGVASRRASEVLIAEGRVTVNGIVVDELGAKVDARDDVRLDDTRVELPEDSVTIMLNKPTGYITTMSDSHGRPTVADLVPVDEHPSLFPIGRLDMNTSGLLLFTTDGELGNRLMHPRFHVNKRYIATIEGELSAAEIALLEDGILLDDGKTSPAEVRILERLNTGGLQAAKSGSGPDPVRASSVQITIHEGRKRQVRRMFSAVGHEVRALERVSFGCLELDGLESGKWRRLSDDEIARLADCAL